MTPQPISSFLQLVPSQFRSAPNFNSWLTANLQLYQDVLACAVTFPTAFSIQYAVGPQLDVLGVILGQSRVVGFQPTEIGSPPEPVSPVLDDPTYRLLLQATILKNHWDGTIPGILAIWQTLFPGGTMIFTDHQNMTVSIYVAGSFPSQLVIDLVTHGYMLPRPEGTLYTYTVATLPMFGTDEATAFISGPDEGYFVA